VEPAGIEVEPVSAMLTPSGFTPPVTVIETGLDVVVPPAESVTCAVNVVGPLTEGIQEILNGVNASFPIDEPFAKNCTFWTDKPVAALAFALTVTLTPATADEPDVGAVMAIVGGGAVPTFIEAELDVTVTPFESVTLAEIRTGPVAVGVQTTLGRDCVRAPIGEPSARNCICDCGSRPSSGVCVRVTGMPTVAVPGGAESDTEGADESTATLPAKIKRVLPLSSIASARRKRFGDRRCHVTAYGADKSVAPIGSPSA
jgi:hypothetical protein